MAHDDTATPETAPEPPATGPAGDGDLDVETADAPTNVVDTAHASASGAAPAPAPGTTPAEPAEPVAVLAPTEPGSADGMAAAPAPAPGTSAAAPAQPKPDVRWAPDDDPVALLSALGWVDPDAVGPSPAGGALPSSRLVPVEASLLPPAKKRRGWAWPVAAMCGLAVGYVGSCAFWPLDHVAPKISDLTIETPLGEEFPVVWPEDGIAALAAEGGPGGAISSSDEALPMASITKIVTALMIIEHEGLLPGDQGPSYTFTYADSQEYLNYLYADESAVDVPVDGSLTLYQMLQGVMLGSANNYVNRLVGEIWGTNDVWLAEAQSWLEANGLTGITLTNPTGISPGNIASARALIALAERALQDPVLSEIMALKSVELPGAGLVENSNPLIDDDGVIGLKTGSLWSTGTNYWNLLAAKQVVVDGTAVTLYSAVVGQPDADGREAVSRSLLSQLELGIQPVTAVAADTTVAHITTEWGAQSSIVTESDAEVLSWQGVAPSTTPSYETGIGARAGAEVGTLSVEGGLNSDEVALVLTDAIPAPSFGWRLTHPLALLGLD